MSFVAASRRRIGAIYLLMLVLVAAGVYTASRLPSAIFPAVTFPLVRVIADVGEEPAARMMPTVTRPLEEAIRRVPGIRHVLSTTSRGSTEIDAQFDWGTDMEVARTRVQAETERVRPDLPKDARIDVEWMNTAIFPILGYAMTSDHRTQAELRELAEYTLKPALLRLPGVAEVQVQGGRRREFEVRLDRAALEGRQLSAADVVEAIQKDDVVLSAGLTQQNHELYLTLVDGRAHSLEELRRIAVPVAGGAPASLGELGEIKTADEVTYVRTTADGHDAVLVSVVRQPSANTVAVAQAVDALLASHPDLVPRDVRWSVFYNQARFVSDSVIGVRDAILIGIGLAGLVLLVFLRRLRLTLIAVAAIPIVVAIVGLGLAALGVTINLMTLAGVAAALGLVADDAIVVIEDIHRHVEREGGGPDAVAEGVREILPALLGSSLSTTVVFLPFALLHGVVGAFFKPLALTMALALAISFFVAWLVVPSSVLALRAAGKEPWPRRRTRPSRRRQRGARLRARLSGAYERAIAFFLRIPVVAVALAIGLLVAAFFLQRTIGTDFLPAMDEGALIVDYRTPPGTSLEDTDAMLRQVEKLIMATPGVKSYSRRTGTQLGFFITEPNRGDYVIELEPRSKRRSIEEIIADLRTRITRSQPAIQVEFGQLLEDNIGDLSGGAPEPIDIKLFGSDPALLQTRARQLAKVLGTVRGVTDIFDGIVVAGPALDVRVRPDAMARYALTTTALHAAIEPAVTGTIAGSVRVGERVYDLRVFSNGAGPLSDLPVRTPSNALVHVSDVATVLTGPPETEIDREDLESYVGVTARLENRDLGGAMGEIQADIRRELPPGGISAIEYGGLYAQQQASFHDLTYVLLGGLVLVAIVVLFEFGDWRAPLVTATLALASLVGSLTALILTGMTLNIASFVGVIMVVGIVGENAIFVIHEARLQLLRGARPRDAWTRASRRRLRPVAMTTLATSLALAPLALGIGQGSQLMRPLAIAIIGGFVLCGVLVLVVLPALYHLADPRGRLGHGPSRPSDWH